MGDRLAGGGELDLDVSSASAGTRAATLEGVGPLQGAVLEGKACFWLTAGGDHTFSLVWPAGSVARADPLRVEDASGHVLAEVGDEELVLTGMPAGGQPGCHPGSSVFYVGDVARSGTP